MSDDTTVTLDVLKHDRLRWQGSESNPHFSRTHSYEYRGTYYNKEYKEKYVKLVKGGGILTHIPRGRFVDLYTNGKFKNESKEMKIE